MAESTHIRLIPCEKHAAILGRQAARLAQRENMGLVLRQELLHMLTAIRGNRLGACSPEAACIDGDDHDNLV